MAKPTKTAAYGHEKAVEDGEIQRGKDAVAAAARRHSSEIGRRRRFLLRRFLDSASGFWRAGGDRQAWILSSAVLFTVFLNLATSLGMNIWNRAIFDALEKKDSGT